MSDYRVVPVEPTSDMLCSGIDAYGIEDCLDADVHAIYTSMIAAAPAVQGEAEITPEMIEAGANQVMITDSSAECAVKVYRAMRAAAPQPAEQQPPPDYSLTPVPDELFAAEFRAWWEQHGQFCRAGGGDYERTFAFEAWRHLYPQLMSLQVLVVEQQPAPDVAGLVEALEQIEQWVKRWCADGHPIAKFAGKALAAHRGQGGGV